MKQWRQPLLATASTHLRFDVARNLMDRESKEIAQLFPNFKPIFKLPWHSAWLGVVEPAFQKYTVRLDFRPSVIDDNVAYNTKIGGLPRATVTCLDPTIVYEHPETGKKLPHVYQYPVAGKNAILCLHLADWTVLDSISAYIIPWISDWFVNYELWLVTGKWLGQEAPHGPLTEDKTSNEMAEGEIVEQKPTVLKYRQFQSSLLENHPYYFSKIH